jgi:hypothetical protein
MKRGICQFKASLSLTIEKKTGLTLNRFAAGIRQLRAFECQLLPMAKGSDLLKMKLFDVVAYLESSLAEFSHALNKSGQVAIHRRFIPLILDDREEHELVSPHSARVCISTRTHLCWDRFQQLLKEARIYSSRR